MQTMIKEDEPSKIQRYATNLFRVVAVGMIPLAAFVPSVRHFPC